MGYGPWGRKESDMTEGLNNSSFSLAPSSFLGMCEGDGWRGRLSLKAVHLFKNMC